jgi:hypothetical protein
VLRTPTGPRVVDVNEFPNYTGALGADAVVAAVVDGRGAEVRR